MKNLYLFTTAPRLAPTVDSVNSTSDDEADDYPYTNFLSVLFFFFLSSTIHCTECMCLIVCSDVALHFHSLPRSSIFVCRMFFIFVFFLRIGKYEQAKKKLCAKLIQNNLFCLRKRVHSVPFTNRVVNRCR